MLDADVRHQKTAKAGFQSLKPRFFMPIFLSI